MATVKTVITPVNIGKTIKLGAIEQNKFDVQLKATDFEVEENGAIKLADAVRADLNKYLKSGAVNGGDMLLTLNDDSTVTIDVSSLVPHVKKDRFLKTVTYNQTDKKLVFTVGSTEEGEAKDATLEVAVSDLLPVVAGNGLEGNGTAASPLKVKTSADAENPIVVDANGVTLDQAKLKAFAKETRDIELQDVAGNTIAYAYSVA